MSRNLLVIILLALFAGTTPLQAADPRLELGEKIFKEHCAECHAKGGNLYRSTKTLSRKDLAANRIRTVEDIIRLIRNPGSSMHRFGPTQMPGEEADAVAFYVLEVFNK
jgi:cytochrome c6